MGQLPFEQRNYEIIVRRKVTTNPKQGVYPDKRPIEELIKSGIININKPVGPTSSQIDSYVKEILHINKAGHGGTLDPNVSGILPIALEESTRIMQALLNSGKEYVCLMHLHTDVSEEKIREVLPTFIRKITQLPPLRSAVKRQEREREVYYLEILEVDGRDILYKVGCQGGTYIRRLSEQIGKELGTNAHMQQLVRTKAGPFNQEGWYSLHDLKDAYEFYKEGKEEELRKIVLPIEAGITHLKKVYVSDMAVNTVCHGASLSLPGLVKFDSDIQKEDNIAMLSLKGELIGLGTSKMDAREMKEKSKGLAIKTNKVFMKRNTYQ